MAKRIKTKQPCAACANMIGVGDAGADVRLSLSIRGGRRTEHMAPICGECSSTAASGPEAELTILRQASRRVLGDER